MSRLSTSLSRLVDSLLPITQIVAAATNCGLTAQWSGSRHERIALQLRDWRKPLAPRPSETV